MHKLLLAAIAALPLASAPVLAQDGNCPPGTSTSNADGSPVTCDNDDNTNDVTGTTADTSAAPANAPQGDSVIDSTDAGQGVKDALSGDGNGGNGNNNNNNNN